MTITGSVADASARGCTFLVARRSGRRVFAASACTTFRTTGPVSSLRPTALGSTYGTPSRRQRERPRRRAVVDLPRDPPHDRAHRVAVHRDDERDVRPGARGGGAADRPGDVRRREVRGAKEYLERVGDHRD